MTSIRLVITAMVVENRPVAQVAAEYGVSTSWLYELLARYRREGESVFEPRSRRPASNPNATSLEVVDLIVRLRKELTDQGLDAGPDTICWHLAHHHGTTVSRATVSRHLSARGLVVPEPKKRPKSSYIRFEAAMPNECWQSDFTHYRLTRPDGRPGADTEILSWLDDCSRFALRITAHHRVTGSIVLSEFTKTVAEHGIPASTLTDNGMVFTTRLSGGKGGRNQLETELRRLGVDQKNAPPLAPPDSRQGRTFPADHEEVATRPTQPARHHCQPPDRPGCLRHRVQPAAATPITRTPSHPSDGLHQPTQGHPRRPHRRHPRPGTPRPRRQGRQDEAPQV
jgi:transposase